MSVKAKRKTILRIIGAILILIGLILSILFNCFLNVNTNIAALIIIPWLFLSTFLKLEFSVFVDNKHINLIILCVYTVGLLIIILMWNQLKSLNLFSITISILALIICWHFSLSIYRKEKAYFVLGGAIYIFTSIFFRLQKPFFLYLETILEIILVSFGLTTILLIEFLLHRKGYLNYIK